jgi:drug/metabolite transporter (DMT)-like permease
MSGFEMGSLSMRSILYEWPVKLRIRAAYLCCCVLWGSTWMFIKLGLRDLPPLLFAGTRMLLAAAVLLPFAARAGLRGYGRRELRTMAFVGILQIGVPYALLFAGQQWVPSGLAAVLFATFPVWLALVARVLLRDQPLTARKIAAAVLGIAGVALLQLPALRGQSLSPLAAAGGGLVLAASVVIAFANVLVRKELGSYPPIVIAFVQVLSGALLLVVLSAALERGRPASFTPFAIFALIYLAVLGTAVTYLFLFWLIPRVPMSAIGAIPLLDTTVAVILAAVVLREDVGWPLIAGGALVLSGAALANQAPAEPAPEAA